MSTIPTVILAILYLNSFLLMCVLIKYSHLFKWLRDWYKDR
jgi:hypothetical protein